MKNAFDELISRLGTAEERISEPEKISIETLRTERQNEKRLEENGAEKPRTKRQLQKVSHTCIGIPEGEEGIRIENFPKLMSDTKPQIQKAREYQAQ